jgi:hypothetical protein
MEIIKLLVFTVFMFTGNPPPQIYIQLIKLRKRVQQSSWILDHFSMPTVLENVFICMYENKLKPIKLF